MNTELASWGMLDYSPWLQPLLDSFRELCHADFLEPWMRCFDVRNAVEGV